VKRLLLISALACLTGCVSAKATKDTIVVKGFLMSIKNGNYTNGMGVGLSVTDASPDQQTIAFLAGSTVELAKALAAKPPTNSVPTP
jgi:hypothetical protein